ncbi:MAG: response regulator [Candidatus Hydrogenedentes bacterium]|nr:response regulator [Candidatus Hydrogenedentota bacterium]
MISNYRDTLPPAGDGEPGDFEPPPRLLQANILLVDDDERNLTALEAILDAPGYRLVRARNADEALLATMKEEFALLVLDVRMPQVGGLELARIIKQRKKTEHLPIIFLSAYYQEETHALLGYGVGAVDYLTKPLNPAVLQSKVAAFVGMYRTNKALQDEIAERRAAERRLAERTCEVQERVIQLRALAMELTQAEQRERKRLARILHDHIQQLIASALLQLSVCALESRDERNIRSLKEIESTLKEAIVASRTLTVELSPPVLDEAGLVAGLNWLAKEIRRKHGFDVHINGDEQAETDIHEERYLLYECARELLFNAVKHSGAGAATISIAPSGNDRIEIVVEDQGAGFDASILGRPSGERGTFGLFSVQQRLTHLGGELQIHSTPGKGTRATVLSPPSRSRKLKRFVQQRDGEARAAVHAGAAYDTSIKVLIVDDQTIMRDALTGLLEREPGIAVIGEASSGPEAISRAAALRPDVVIMDVNLGDTSGIQATKEILEHDADISVVSLSMHDEAEVAEAMRKAGAIGCLTKDAAAEELITVIRSTRLGPPERVPSE